MSRTVRHLISCHLSPCPAVCPGAVCFALGVCVARSVLCPGGVCFVLLVCPGGVCFARCTKCVAATRTPPHMCDAAHMCNAARTPPHMCPCGLHSLCFAASCARGACRSAACVCKARAPPRVRNSCAPGAVGRGRAQVCCGPGVQATTKRCSRSSACRSNPAACRPSHPAAWVRKRCRLPRIASVRGGLLGPEKAVPCHAARLVVAWSTRRNRARPRCRKWATSWP